MLEPLLILIFINDVADPIHSCMHLYADDCVYEGFTTFLIVHPFSLTFIAEENAAQLGR